MLKILYFFKILVQNNYCFTKCYTYQKLCPQKIDQWGFLWLLNHIGFLNWIKRAASSFALNMRRRGCFPLLPRLHHLVPPTLSSFRVHSMAYTLICTEDNLLYLKLWSKASVQNTQRLKTTSKGVQDHKWAINIFPLGTTFWKGSMNHYSLIE